MFDIIIVGSGPSGVISAQSFIDKGYAVCLLDTGVDGTTTIPFKHFSEQLTCEAQLFYPPDDDSLSAESGGAQVTKARAHLLNHVVEYLKVDSPNFSPFQTLATGGLSAAWGAACFTYTDSDLKRASLSNLDPHYEAVAKLIGISGPTKSHFCSIKNKQKPAMLDHNGQSLLNHRTKAFTLEQSSMALLTDPLNGRSPNPHFDMDFYSNFGDSIFRSDCLLKTLTQHSNFTRIACALVTNFKETAEQVEVKYLDIKTSTTQQVKAGKLVICAGAINSYRLVANSLQIFNRSNPILCNPYVHIPAIHLPNLGKKGAHHRHSLSQLFGEFHKIDNMTLQFYSYRSLLLSRLMAQTPMPAFFARLFWRSLVESLVIVGAHISDDGKSPRSIQAIPCEVLPGLKIDFPTPAIKGTFSLAGNLLKLGCMPMGILKTKMGASIHYAGTIPISAPGQYPIGMNAQGLIHNTQNVYVFDSSGWTYLPSRGLTFTIMANAHRLSEELGNVIA
jgi:choline dehydrogenase-like flavoprotein